MLLWQGYGINSDTRLDENFVVLVKAVQYIGDQIQSVSAYGIMPNKVAEVQECCETSNHITRHMACNGW